ncbi:MAG: PKD-like domain-containing protein, partial [Bacteroidota bacterium]
MNDKTLIIRVVKSFIGRITGNLHLSVWIFIVFLFIDYQGFSQVVVSPTGKPNSLVTCYSDGVFSLQIANTTGGTMSGAMLALNLPIGIRYTPGSVTGATEFNISNLNQPVFSLPDISNNTAHGVTYNSGAVCGYTNTQNFVYTVTYNSSNYTCFDTPLQNYYYPEPVITNITNATATIPVNTTVTRNITIQQQGSNSSMDTLWLLDSHTADIQVVSTSIGTLHLYVGASPTKVDTIIITGADFPGGNGLFDASESIVVSETVKLVGCTNGQSTLKASWGCFKQLCNYYSAFPTVSPTAGTTSLAMAFTNNNYGWGFIDNHGWVEFKITNNGTGAGTAFDLVPLAGFSSGGSTYYPNSNWINKIDSFSVNGIKIGAQYTYGAGALNGQYAFYTTLPYFSDPDGAGVGLEDADGDGLFDDLPIGKTVTIKAHCYYSWAQAQSTIATRSSCGYGWTASAYQAFRYGYNFKNQCSTPYGVTWVPNATVLMFHTYDTRTARHSMPPDLFDGVTVWMEHEVVTSTAVSPEGCPNDSVVYKLFLPRGISLGTGTATFKGVSMGTPLINGDSVFFFLSRTKILSGGLFRVPLVLSCNLSPPAYGYVHAELKFYCDRINYKSRYFTYWCSNSPTFWMQCPPPNCPDPSISQLKVTRTTLGWINKNLAAKVLPSTAGLRLDNAMSRDTIRVEANGRLNGTIDSLYFKLKHDAIGGAWGNQLFFDYVADTLYFYDRETNSWHVCSGLSPVITNGSTSTLITYFGNLTSPGNCLNGYGLTSGDSLHYVVYGRIKNIAQTEWYTVPVFRGYFFYKDLNKENSCDSRGVTFNVLGSNFPAVASTFYQQIVLQGCTQFQYEGLFYRSMESCGGDGGFPNEYRPFVVLDTLIFTLPEGFVYQTGTSYHTYFLDNGSSVSELIADPIIDVSSLGTKLIFIRAPSWSYSDYIDCWNTYDRIVFYATPSCKATGDYAYNIDARGRYQFMANGIGVRTSNTYLKPITYTTPLMSLTKLITTAEGREDTVVWKVSVCNQRPFTASNSWIAFESASNGIHITDVTDITNPAAPITIPVANYGPGKYWSQLGNYNSMACKTYRIRAIYTSCHYDSILVRRGYNCASYPLNPELGYPPTGYQCNETGTYLYLDPKDVSLNLTAVSPANPVNLCDTLEYDVQVTNSQPATAYNLTFTISVPPGVGIMSGKSQIKYPYTSGTYKTISDPVNIPPGSDKWVYSLSTDPNGVLKLKGVDSIPKNGYKIKFRIITDCNFISGTNLKLIASATNACGDEKERSSFSQPILVSGLPTNTNLYVLNTVTGSGFHTCNLPSPVHVKVINLGPASISNIEKLSVSITEAYDYVNGSLVNIHNGPSGIASNTVTGGKRYLYFAISPNLAVNDSIVFDFQLHDVDPGMLICDTISIVTSTLLVGKVYCTLIPGDSCVIQSITASMTTLRPVIKDHVGFGSYTASSVPNGTSGENVSVTYKIKNTGTASLQTSMVNVVFVHDANGNGLPDETGADSLYYQSVLVNNLAAGDSISATALFTVPAAKVCNMIAAIRLSSNPCSCNDDLLHINNIRFVNAGPDLQVCQQTNLQIGLPPTTGYTYIWVPSTFLSSGTIASPTFNYNSLLTNSITLTYSLITTRTGGCMSKDTVLITVLPAPTSFAGSDTTICQGSYFQNNKSTAANFSSISWGTSGTGTFTDSTILHSRYNPSTVDISNGSVILTITVLGLCGTSSDNLTLHFSPQATAFAGVDTTICESWSYSILDAMASSNTGVRWKTLGNGVFNDTTMLHPTYTPGSADIVAGFVKLVLKSNGIAPCNAARDTMKLTLKDPPTVTNSPPSKQICSNDQTNITITSNQPGTMFTWTTSLISGSISGFSNGTGPFINQVLVNSGTIPGSVLYTILPNNGGCPGLPFNFTVIVNPIPSVINSPPDTSICSGNFTQVSLQSSVAGSSF